MRGEGSLGQPGDMVGIFWLAGGGGFDFWVFWPEQMEGVKGEGVFYYVEVESTNPYGTHGKGERAITYFYDKYAGIFSERVRRIKTL